jgi:eukaryotic-like serine/threonine-protein kinase
VLSSSQFKQRAVWGWSTTFDAEEARVFLAQRVALYARMIGLFFSILYGAGVVLVLVAAPEQIWAVHLHVAKIANVVVVAIAFGVWWLVRRPGCPDVVIIAGDAAIPLVLNLSVAVAAPHIPAGFSMAMSFVPLLINVLGLMFRAAFVPSPPLRTAGIGAISSVPTIWSQYQLASHAVLLPEPLTPTLLAIGTATWSLALVLGTALVSKEIYGLRTEVVKALRLGQYTLERLIGEGGMGAVYVARHARLRRPTALKLILPDRTSAESLARFEREAQLTSQLTHPNTVAIYDFGRTPDGVFYYAMEYIDGLSLEALVEQHGPQPEARIVHILTQAAGALTEAHTFGLIHRDVKPANILLCERAGSGDVVKLLDFGLVKDIRPGAEPALTQRDVIAGTPLYLAPEVLTDASAVDHRADLYALGAVGYCLLTGTPPFQGRSTIEVCGHHLHTPPEPPSQRLGKAVHPGLEALLLACLAKNPADRPASASELQRRLGACASELVWTPEDAKRCWQGTARARDETSRDSSTR